MGNWSIYDPSEPRDTTGKWTKGAGSHAGGKHLARNQKRRAKEKARRGTPEQRAHLAAEIKHSRNRAGVGRSKAESDLKGSAARSKIAQRAREHKAEREGREAPGPRKRGAGAKMVRAERKAKAKAETRGESLASHLEAGHRVSIRTKAGNIAHLRATKTEGGKVEITVHHERTGRQIHTLGEHTGEQLRARLAEHGGYARRLDLPKREAVAASTAHQIGVSATTKPAPPPATTPIAANLRDTEVKLNRAQLDAANPNRTAFERDRAGRRAGAEDLMARVTRARMEKAAEAPEQPKPTPSPFGAPEHEKFGLRNFTTPQSFDNTGKGKTKPMFEEMRGAAGKDLPGQSTFLDRDKADHRIASPEARKAAEFEASVKAKRARLAAKLRAQRAEVQASRRDPSTHTDHEPGTLTTLNTDLIHHDPTRFQYKLAHSESGSVGSLAGVGKWDDNLGGVLQVWKDPANGKTYVVNGHNRLDLAKKLGASKVRVAFLKAKDAQEARSIGALTNIAEGRGTSLDAAKFMRDTGHTGESMKSLGVPMKERVAHEGAALATLHPRIFDRVVSGDLPAERGAIIGGGALTHEQQAAVMTHLDKMPKGKAPSNATLRETIDNARAAPTVTKTTHSLFGDDEESASLALHRGAVQAHVKERLSREKRVFGTVAKERNATDLKRGGNQINAAESGKISAAADHNLQVFDLLKNRSGPVAHLLNEGAERVHAGEKVKHVHEDIYKRLPHAIRESLGG